MGSFNCDSFFKVPEDCPSVFWLGGIGLAVGMRGGGMGQGGHFNNDNSFKWAEKCP